MDEQRKTQKARIKVIGIGGGGNNAVSRMIEEGIAEVEFYIANTDEQILSSLPCANKIFLGKTATRGLGAGSNPALGRAAALECEGEIKKILEGSDLVFIAAGMGGGTGTGAAPIFAKIARELGALTIAVVTRPFSFEGKDRNVFASEGLQELRHNVDSLLVISNDRLLQSKGEIPLKDAFKEADDILRQSVQTITELITIPSLINLDFADIKNIMSSRGMAMIGLGRGRGVNKAKEAANMAINSPLLESSIIGASQAIVSITGGSKLTLFDASDAVEVIRNASSANVNIIFGVSINELFDDEIFLTLIATDFNEQLEKEKTPDKEKQYKENFSSLIDIDKTLDNIDLSNDDNKIILPSFLRKR